MDSKVKPDQCATAEEFTLFANQATQVRDKKDFNLNHTYCCSGGNGTPYSTVLLALQFKFVKRSCPHRVVVGRGGLEGVAGAPLLASQDVCTSLSYLRAPKSKRERNYHKHKQSID